MNGRFRSLRPVSLAPVPVDPAAWITALIFGIFLGWSVSRNPEDRPLGTKAVGVLIAFGAAAWAAGPTSGSQHAMAAVSMTFAGISALIVARAIEARERVRR
jgi:hypothetical protein